MDLNELLDTDSPRLIGIIDFWKDYDAKTVLLAYAELKKRDYFIPERLLNKTYDFAEKNNFSNIDEFLKSKMNETEFYSFNEYFNKEKNSVSKINSDKTQSTENVKEVKPKDETTGYYLLGFSSILIYTLIMAPPVDVLFIADYIGAGTPPLLISLFITLFQKEKKFGKVFGITCMIVCTLAAIGNLTHS